MSGICSFFCPVQTSAKTGKVYSIEVGISGHFTVIEARLKYRIASKVQIRYLSASDPGLLSFIQLKVCHLVHRHLKTGSVVRNLHLWNTTWERYRQPRNYHPPPELMPQKCLGNQESGQLWVCWGMVYISSRKKRSLLRWQSAAPPRWHHMEGGSGCKQQNAVRQLWAPQSAGNTSVEPIPESPSDMRHSSGSRAFEGEDPKNTAVTHLSAT